MKGARLGDVSYSILRAFPSKDTSDAKDEYAIKPIFRSVEGNYKWNYPHQCGQE